MQAVQDFVARRGPWLAAPAGAALALAFAPVGLVPLAFLCPALLFVLWQGASPRRAAWLGFLFTGGTFLAGTYWLYHSIHLVGGAPVWIAAFLMLGLVAIMGGYSAVLGYAVARWGPPAGALRWLVLLPAGWVLVEWFRGWFLSGFPWLALGYTQLDTPLAGWAPVAGVYGTSLAVRGHGRCARDAADGPPRRAHRRRRGGGRPVARRRRAGAHRVDHAARDPRAGGAGAGRGAAVDEVAARAARAHAVAVCGAHRTAPRDRASSCGPRPRCRRSSATSATSSRPSTGRRVRAVAT